MSQAILSTVSFSSVTNITSMPRDLIIQYFCEKWCRKRKKKLPKMKVYIHISLVILINEYYSCREMILWEGIWFGDVAMQHYPEWKNSGVRGVLTKTMMVKGKWSGQCHGNKTLSSFLQHQRFWMCAWTAGGLRHSIIWGCWWHKGCREYLGAG